MSGSYRRACFFRACRPVSRAKRSAMIKLLVLSSLSAAGQPQEGVPCLAADVRPPIAKRAVFADLWRSPRPRGAVSVTKYKECEAPARRRKERSGAGAAHRSGCSRSARSPGGAKWRNRGNGAEPPYVKRCALRRCVSQCAFERSEVLSDTEQSEAEHYDSCRTAAGRRSPALLWLSSNLMRSVRSSPPCGEVRVYAELVLSIIMRGPAGRRTERSGGSGAARSGFSGVREVERSEVEKPW